MKNYPLIAAVAGALLTSGCDQASNPSAQKPVSTSTTSASTGTDAVALVNGKPISKAALDMLQAEIGQRRGGGNIPEDKLLEELVKRELLRQEADSAGLLKDPKYAARLENAQRMLLAQAAAEHFIGTVKIGDEDLKKEYDQRIGPMKTSEFKARHILVETEKEATDIIAKLDKGAKFEELAKKLSKDPGSKEKGGDLGWFNPQQMVQPFSDAVIGLKNGELAKTPVKSQFGFHIIRREDSREQAPPPFDAVKDQLRSVVQTQKLQQHLAELESKAKIENRLPKPPATPPAAVPPAVPGIEAGQPKAPGAAPAGKPAATESGKTAPEAGKAPIEPTGSPKPKGQ